ncbi:Mov34/MPN/PAD-1 family protein [Geothrix limicola]|uniref:Mov34/MPN/PAD-1 family protein n=1 Tax=Geothrix limicola TaxID=2927978 RepID=UPI00255766CC|nr:Mov34/MPN/PAD-1 family protein [Geothrix limicola]
MLSYWLPDRVHQVHFTPEALHTLTAFQQVSNDPEAGGQLFARFCNGNAMVMKATSPKAADRRSKFGFRQNKTAAQAEILEEYENGLHFIGDWHSHPEPTPHPSGLDRASSRSVFKKSKKDIGAFLVVILGTSPFPSGIFVGMEDGDKLVELTPVTRQQHDSYLIT